ncbi:MAG: ornithine carbamoyltransferase, partial [Pseudohongiellaceae bacterium]
MGVRHFLTLLDLSKHELLGLLDRASALKQLQRNHQRHDVLARRTLAMIFEKASTRTRVSFET